jgi:hypothetical protein
MVRMTDNASDSRCFPTRRILLGCLVAAVAVSACVLAAGDPDTEPRSKAEREFDEKLARTGVVRLREDDPMGEDRTKRIAALVAIVRSEDLVAKDRTKVHNAILRLGRLKALEGADALAERLDLHLTPSGLLLAGDRVIDDVEYPAIGALVAIGEGALPYIVDALFERERSKMFRWNALFAISWIAGGDEKGKKYLRRRLALYNRGAKDLTELLKDKAAQ